MPPMPETGARSLRGRSFRGRPASPGLAAGTLVLLDDVSSAGAGAQVAESKSPDGEAERLRGAITAATQDLAGLMDQLDEETAGIIEFQIAMLEDDALVEPALLSIREGIAAEAAWQAALDAQVADYEAAEDEYFQARGSDLKDLRDRVLRNLRGASGVQALPDGAVLAGHEITPSRFLETDWSRGGGLALRQGSPSSHVAMLARARGVPMVVGLGDADLPETGEVLLNGDDGILIVDPDDQERAAFSQRRKAASDNRRLEESYRGKPAVTGDGTAIAVMINVADPDELDDLDPADCDGIGLVRSEFLFHGPGGLPDEEQQYLAYRRILRWAGDKPVVIRTLDAGGDKPIAGLTADNESNPFLGLRGLRLSLARPEVFKVQLRALARAALQGNLKIMLPMVTRPEELTQARRLYAEALAALRAEGVACGEAPLGMMVEVPAAAIAPELFAEAAFFSIGSNDLTQYVTAAGRDIAAVADLNDSTHPAVLKLIRALIEGAAAMERDVSLCGDAGGEPSEIPGLLRCGLRSLSVAPLALGRAKAAIAETDLAGAHA
ncbi:phosphoenolpyruvate--protein phosphotransferase [Pelagibius sp.]|uniref:phosphoenolpyruvate--protein phosphotransferase n=1 Tax=Pelagibius sp. TaxID=1931238 RepID=UPI003BB1A448